MFICLAPRHPGGMMICGGAGIDATEMFKHFHHDGHASQVLPDYCIGTLKAGEKMPAPVA